MYESFYGLFRRPFAAAPDSARYCGVGPIEHARQTLSRCIERAEGPALVVGPSGVGKSLLLGVLADQYRSRFLIAALNSSGLCTRRALLQNILFELRLPYRDRDEGELRLSLVDRLEPRNSGDGLLLLIDEAHTLPVRLLEEVRLITNLVRDGQPRVRLVLAAGPAMEERLANPKLDSFQQRLAARCYLHALTRAESDDYLNGQWTAAGGVVGRVFTPAALRAVFAATDGVPRLLNQLCDHALLLGATHGRTELDAAAIEEAWADLQQLPLPWAPEPAPKAASEVIEFGELDQAAPPAGAPALADLPAEELNFTFEFGSPAPEPIEAAPWAAPPLAQAGGTEVELVFQAESQLFGDGFEEEQVVIDHYATLDAAERVQRHRVACEEGREIARFLAPPPARAPAAIAPELDLAWSEQTSQLEPAPQTVRFAPAAEAPPQIAAQHTQRLSDREELDFADDADAFYPALDPLTPDPDDAGSPTRRAIPLRAVSDDDRDLILIEEGASEANAPHPPLTRGRRQEYRNLFSSLRKGQ